MKRSCSVAIVTMILATSGAVSAEPGVQPGLLDALCATRVPPDPDCVTIAYPAVDVWAVSAVVPIASGAEAAYDALIPEPFMAPAERALGVLMFRLDIPADPSTSIDSDPGEGYAEGSVAIRVGFPAADGFPYTEGWWDLAQPLNDQSQYGAGRGIGLPKYMADASVHRNDDGTWSARAVDWGKADGIAPGSQPLPDGNILAIEWQPDDPGVSSQHAEQLQRWGQYGDPLFVQTGPYDEVTAHDPAMVKFTTTSLVPVSGVERTVVTEYPDPIVGTARVRLEGTIPGAHDAVSAGPFAQLLAPGTHTVAGTVAFARGYAFVTSDNLANNIG